MKIKIGMVSLGCAKNLVDSEMILGMLVRGDFVVVNDPSIADVIIVNTCGFIGSAKEEAIDAIFEMSQHHKKLVVVGCLVERYADELKKSIPEVDLFVPIRDYQRLPELINGLFNKNVINYGLDYEHRLLSTPFFTAYLKISDGCDNRCTYCAIPLIRGGFKSRPILDLISEAKILASKGIKELVVISQDTTKYGADLLDGSNIVCLLKELLKIKEFIYIRLLYLYPDEITDDLLQLIAKEKRLTPYFDLPIQHASSKILKSMNRRGDKEYLEQLMKKIRKIVPNAILRTTLIVGFPGETEDDFNELYNFVESIQFDHLGAFTYSKEEGTVAFNFKNQIPENVKKKRLDSIMSLQRKIAYHKNITHIGEVMEGIVVSCKSNGDYELRSGYNSPDNIDGKIIFSSKRKLSISEQVKVKIINALAYDLYGEIIEN